MIGFEGTRVGFGWFLSENHFEPMYTFESEDMLKMMIIEDRGFL